MNPQPWYQEGLKFHCTGCGGCCTGDPGYVWVNQSEIAALAQALGLEPEEVERTLVRAVGRRKSLIELPNGDCVFFDRVRRQCRVYADRPRQCRTWPFWESNLRTPEDWEQTCRVCPGSGRGRLVPLDRIEAQSSARRL
jgi:uncharacterized protein